MQADLWNVHAAEEISELLKYWVDMWEELVDEIDDPLFSFSIATPATTLRDIVLETTLNGLRNSELRAVYESWISTICKMDDVVGKRFAVEFGIIKKNFATAGPDYLGELCRIALTSMGDKEYGVELCRQLVQILTTEPAIKDVDRKLRYLTRTLIVELMHLGYSLKTIRKIPSRLFDNYRIHNGRVHTDFPLDIDQQRFLNGETLDTDAYGRAVRTAMDGLSISARLAALSSFTLTQPRERTYIFQVRGLKGEKPFALGPVQFYSPRISPRAPATDGHPPDDLFRANPDNETFMNAETRVLGIDSEEDKHEAAARVDAALDVLRAYFSSEAAFQLNKDEYVVAEVDGTSRGKAWSMSPQSEVYQLLHGLDADDVLPENRIDQNVRDYLAHFLFENENQWTRTEKIVARSLKYYRKAEESLVFEDKLLNYWIALENLFDFPEEVRLRKSKPLTKVELLLDLVPVIQASQLAFVFGWRLYHFLRGATARRIGSSPPLVLPEEIMSICNLNPPRGTLIHLRPLLENLDAIDALDLPRIASEKVSETKLFYADPKHACEAIEAAEVKVREDLVLIYRFRNRIVHRADFNRREAQFYLRRAAKHAGDVLRNVIWRLASKSSDSPADALLRAYAEAESRKERLRRREPINLD